MKKTVTFGEIRLHLAPPGFQCFTQARSFEVIQVTQEIGTTVPFDLKYRLYEVPCWLVVLNSD